MRFPTEHGCFELEGLPGCRQIVVSTNAFIEEEYRGKGNGNKAHQSRLQLMRELRYDYAICTVVSTNEAQRHILASNGWKKLDEFKSRVTKNTVELWSRKIERI